MDHLFDIEGQFDSAYYYGVSPVAGLCGMIKTLAAILFCVSIVLTIYIRVTGAEKKMLIQQQRIQLKC